MWSPECLSTRSLTAEADLTSAHQPSASSSARTISPHDGQHPPGPSLRQKTLQSGQRRSSTNRSSQAGHSYTTYAVVTPIAPPLGVGAGPHHPGPSRESGVALLHHISFSNGTVIARVNPTTGKLEDIIPLTNASGTILEGTGGLVWVLFQAASSSSAVYSPSPSKPGGVGRIDPRTDTFVGEVLRIGAVGDYDPFLASGKRAWVGVNSKVIALES